MFDFQKTVLLVIDVQKGFEEMDRAGRHRNNPQALDCIAELLAAFRAAKLPIIHVHHRGTAPDSFFRADGPGFAVIDRARPLDGETVLVKTVNSAFIGTGLEEHLRNAGLHTLIICGATANHCVETSTRMAGNLGFDARLVRDAIWAYDRTGVDGEPHTADEILAVSLANLNEEFASIVTAAKVVQSIPPFA
jgi:nicotinamidase-related amidase